MKKTGWIILIVGVIFTMLLIYFTGGFWINEDYTAFYFNRQSIPELPFIARTDKLCITRGSMQNADCLFDLMEIFMDRSKLFIVIETPEWIYR